MDSETCNRLIVGMSELVQNSLLSQIIIKTGVDTNGAPYVDIQSNWLPTSASADENLREFNIRFCKV